jgi:hypothetical protein
MGHPGADVGEELRDVVLYVVRRKGSEELEERGAHIVVCVEDEWE